MKTTTDPSLDFSSIPSEVEEHISAFEQHYDYDASYIRALYASSPACYEAYRGFLPMASVREKTPAEVWFTAALIATQSEDCGPCVQLTVRMAREAGVDPEIIQSALNGGKGLPPELQEVREFAWNMATNEPENLPLRESLLERYGPEILAELSVAIAALRVFPTLKRGLGFAKSCSLVNIEV